MNGNIEHQSVCEGQGFELAGASGGLLSNKDVFVCAGYQCYSLSSTGTLVPTLSTDSLVKNADSLVSDDTLLIVGGEIEPDDFKYIFRLLQLQNHHLMTFIEKAIGN